MTERQTLHSVFISFNTDPLNTWAMSVCMVFESVSDEVLV